MTEIEFIEKYNQILQLNIPPQTRIELFLNNARYFLHAIFNELRSSTKISGYKIIKASIDSLILEPYVSNLISDHHVQEFFFLSKKLGKPALIDMYNNVTYLPMQTYNIGYQMMGVSQLQYIPSFATYPPALNVIAPFTYIPMQYTNHNMFNRDSITTSFYATNQQQFYASQQQATFNLGFSSTDTQQSTQIGSTHKIESITRISKITIEELNTKSVSVDHVSDRSMSEPPALVMACGRKINYIESSSYELEEYITEKSIVDRPISAPPNLQLAQISYDQNTTVSTLPKIKESIATHADNTEITDITPSSNSITIAEPNNELLNHEQNNRLSNGEANRIFDNPNIIKEISVDATKNVSTDKSLTETKILKQSRPRHGGTPERITPLFSEIVKKVRFDNKSEQKTNTTSKIESKLSTKTLVHHTIEKPKKGGTAANLDVKDIVRSKNSISKLELDKHEIKSSASNKFDVLFDEKNSDDEISLTPVVSLVNFSSSNDTDNRKKTRKNWKNESVKKNKETKSNNCNAKTISEQIKEALDNYDYTKYNDLHAKTENKSKLRSALLEHVRKNDLPKEQRKIYEFFLLVNITLTECEELIKEIAQSSTDPVLLALVTRKIILLKELKPESNFLLSEYVDAVYKNLHTEELKGEDVDAESTCDFNKEIAHQLGKIFLEFFNEILTKNPGEDIDIMPYIPILNISYSSENKTPLMLGLESSFGINTIIQMLHYTALPTLLQFDNNSMNVIHYALLNITEHTITIIDLLFKKVVNLAHDNRDIFNRFVNGSGPCSHIFWDMIVCKQGPLNKDELVLLKKFIAPQLKDSLTFNVIESIIYSTEPDRPLQETVYYKILKKFVNKENSFCDSVLKKCEHYITAYKHKVNNNYKPCKSLKICKFTDILFRINDVAFFEYLHQKGIISVESNELLASLLFYAEFDNGNYSISNYIYNQINNTPNLTQKSRVSISNKIWESGLKLPCTALLEWALDNNFINTKSEYKILQSLLDNSIDHEYNRFKSCIEKILNLPKKELAKLCANELNLGIMKAQLTQEKYQEISSLFVEKGFILDISISASRLILPIDKEEAKVNVKIR